MCLWQQDQGLRDGQEIRQRVWKSLAGAQPLAQQESFTPAWFALRTEPNIFYIVDAFANAADRERHLGGEIAKALMINATELLAEAPKIERAEVLGVKLPG